MKIKQKIFTGLVILLGIILICSTISLGGDYYTPTEFKNEIDTSSNETAKVKDVGGQVVGLIQVVGTMVSVGMIIVLGIKYMVGSAEERAEYKKTFFPYFIGAVLIFAATKLTQVIYEWAIKL